MRLREVYDREEICRNRYWKIPKEERIRYGLRPDVGADGFSSIYTLDLGRDLLTKAFRGTYPIETDNLTVLTTAGFPSRFAAAEDLVAILDPMISEVEARLENYEAQAVDQQKARTGDLT